MLRVALSILGLHNAAQDLDGDRPGRAFRGRSTVVRPPARNNDPRFADWLGQALHQTFDPVAQEPLPRDLVSLISRLEKPADEHRLGS